MVFQWCRARTPLCTRCVATRHQLHTESGASRLGRPVAISRLDAGPRPLALGRQSDPEVSASRCCCAAGHTETAPPLASQAPNTCTYGQALEARHAPTIRWSLWTSLDGWAFRAASVCPAALCSRESWLSPPITTGLYGAQRGQWCRLAVDPPASRYGPLHRVGDAVGYGLDALAPLCTPIGKQRLPNAIAKALSTNVGAYE